MTHDVLDEPAPRLTTDGVRRIAEDHWGVTGDVAPLSSERDANFLVGTTHVLKVSNPAESRALVEMEVAAMRHVEATDPDLPVPRSATADGEAIVTITDDDGRDCLARLITTVPGAPLEGQVVTEDLAEQVGAATARTAQALRGFFHPAAGSRALDWDVRALPRVAARWGLTADDPLHPVVERVAAVLPRLAALPSGIHHGDVTLTNLLATDGPVTGVIDFGDMHFTADVADLAVALTSVLRNTSETQVSSPWELAGATLRGYQRIRPAGARRGRGARRAGAVAAGARHDHLPRSRGHPPRQHGVHHAVRRRQRAYDDRAGAAVTERAGTEVAPARRHPGGRSRRRRG